MDVPFEELKSKDELFNFFEEGSCTHAGLMEFCEDYKKHYDTDLCWPYPIAGDSHLGAFLVLVREGVGRQMSFQLPNTRCIACNQFH